MTFFLEFRHFESVQQLYWAFELDHSAFFVSGHESDGASSLPTVGLPPARETLNHSKRPIAPGGGWIVEYDHIAHLQRSASDRLRRMSCSELKEVLFFESRPISVKNVLLVFSAPRRLLVRNSRSPMLLPSHSVRLDEPSLHIRDLPELAALVRQGPCSLR